MKIEQRQAHVVQISDVDDLEPIICIFDSSKSESRIILKCGGRQWFAQWRLKFDLIAFFATGDIDYLCDKFGGANLITEEYQFLIQVVTAAHKALTSLCDR